MKAFTSKNQRLGLLGENIACRYLQNKGFRIIERNHTKKWGEIDIIAIKDVVTYFIEVKAVSRDLSAAETARRKLRALDEHRPEDMLHRGKRARLARIIGTYLALKGERPWQFDLACVYIDRERRRARVKMLPNIVL